MFTGIIEAVGTVKSLRRAGRSAQLEVQTPWPDLAAGESIAVDGACLTVATVLKTGFATDVSPGTLARTIIGGYSTGRTVNLERAMALGGRLGGHLVAGHVDCTAKLRKVVRHREAWDIKVTLERGGLKYIAGKGSVAVNGISLTVAAKLTDGFSLAIVPHTLLTTTIGSWRAGDMVNIEFDQVAKYVESITVERT